MHMWFVVLNGVRLPTPYLHRDDAWAEMRRLERENQPCIVSIELVDCGGY